MISRQKKADCAAGASTSLMPKRMHLVKTGQMPLNKYLEDTGVKLVNRYVEKSMEKKRLIDEMDAELELLKEAIVAMQNGRIGNNKRE